MASGDAPTQQIIIPSVSTTIRDTLVADVGTIIYNVTTQQLNLCISKSAAAASWEVVTTTGDLVLNSANLFVGNASNLAVGVAMTGDISISNAGVTAIEADKIVNADVNSAAAIAASKLSGVTTPTSTDTFTNKTFDANGTGNAISNIENADIAAGAAIALSKLAALTSANIIVGSAGNVATEVAVTGDVTISNAGVTAIGASKITETMMADDAIGLPEIKAGTAGNLITYDASGNPAAVATGTAAQVLTSNGAGAAPTFQAAAGGGNVVKEATATWSTTFSSTSNTYVDVTSATITLSGLTSGTTYDLIAFAITSMRNNTSGDRVFCQLVIDGTASAVAGANMATASQLLPAVLHSIKEGVTGATSYIAKLQMRVNGAGTGVINDIPNEEAVNARIILVAIAR